MDEKKIVSADNAEEEIDIFYKRPSVTLTVDNARFYRSGGGLISLELKGENGEIEAFERVVAIRSFPITDPDAFISIREPDSAEHEKGAEIGIIPDINTVIVSGNDRTESGLVRQINPPVYMGAIVVCQGADDPTVQLAIIDAVSKITGLGTHRISVLKMN